MISSKLADEEEVTLWVPPPISPIDAYGKAESSMDRTAFNKAKVDSTRDIEQEIEDAKLIGYQEGLADGEARAKEIAAVERDELAKLLSSVQARFTQIDESTQQALVHFAFELGRTIVRRELESDQQYYLDMLQSVSEELDEKSHPVSIKMHPDDIDLLYDGTSTSDPALLNIVKKDKSLPRGSCFFETSISYIDAGIDSMIDRMAAEYKATLSSAAVSQ